MDGWMDGWREGGMEGWEGERERGRERESERAREGCRKEGGKAEKKVSQAAKLEIHASNELLFQINTRQLLFPFWYSSVVFSTS